MFSRAVCVWINTLWSAYAWQASWKVVVYNYSKTIKTAADYIVLKNIFFVCSNFCNGLENKTTIVKYNLRQSNDE